MKKEQHHKIVLIGDPKVGKTSIRKRYMGFGFTKSHLMTIGADFSEKEIATKDGENEDVVINLQIWDIAGQDSFKTIRNRFLSKTSGILLVFDLTREATLLNLNEWLKVTWRVNQRRDIPLLIIGNKLDLEKEREISHERVTEYLRKLSQNVPELKLIHYLETSVLSGHNIEQGFNLMANFILSSNGLG